MGAKESPLLSTWRSSFVSLCVLKLCMLRCLLGSVVSFGLKNGGVLVVSLLLDGFHSVCVFFVLLALLVGCGWCGSVGLVVLLWRRVLVVFVWDLGRWCWVVLLWVVLMCCVW